LPHGGTRRHVARKLARPEQRTLPCVVLTQVSDQSLPLLLEVVEATFRHPLGSRRPKKRGAHIRQAAPIMTVMHTDSLPRITMILGNALLSAEADVRRLESCGRQHIDHPLRCDPRSPPWQSGCRPHRRISRAPVAIPGHGAQLCADLRRWRRVLPVLCEVAESGEPSRLASGSGCRAGSMDTVSPGSPEGRSQILASSVNEPHPSAWQSCRPFSYEAWPIIWPVISPSSARNCGRRPRAGHVRSRARRRTAR
jgi:hypothetical protein